MKKLTIIAGLLLASTSIFAQSQPIKFSVRGTLALPTGDLETIQSTGGIFELQANKPLSENVSLFGSIGYGGFSGKKGTDGSSILPILAGLNFDGKIFHAGLGLGYARIASGSESVGGFTFRPEVGVNLSKKVQLNLNYSSTKTKDYSVNYVGITPVIKF